MHKAEALAACYYWNDYYKKHGVKNHFDLWCPKQWAVPIIGEKEYDYLAGLTESLGGFVNYYETAIHGFYREGEIEKVKKQIMEK